MMQQQLSEEELGETLQRARQIAAHGRDRAGQEAAYEGYLRAAEEMGISREAVLQALCERLLIPAEQFDVGQMVFAPSMDGCWYLAEILTLGEHVASVRFLSGGESSVALADLRPASLIPGRRLQADCKGWGWWDAQVKEFKKEGSRVRVIYEDGFGTEETVSLRKLRLTTKTAHPPSKEQRALAVAKGTLVRAGALGGVLGLGAGMLLMKLLEMLLPFLR